MMMTYQKKNIKKFLIKLAIFMCFSALIFASLFFSAPIERIINNTGFFASFEFLNSKFSVHFIDVGQGDCSFIKVGDASIMIDTGTKDSSKNIIRYLNNVNMFENSKIDYLILTHPDNDHIGGAVDLLDYFEFENIYRPKLYSSYEVDKNLNVENFNVNFSSLWATTTKKILDETENVFYSFKGESFCGDNFEFNFYSPFDNNIDEDNDYSPIMMLKVFNKRFIFTGDASIETENEFLKTYASEVATNSFDCDVLKVAHHGSKSSTSQLFLSAIKPEVAVISCALDNSYGHQSNTVINNLLDTNCKVMRTDTMGSVVVVENEGVLSLKSGFNYISSIYFEWWMFVVSLEIILAFVLFIKIKS